jgi:hypothetical protein
MFKVGDRVKYIANTFVLNAGRIGTIKKYYSDKEQFFEDNIIDSSDLDFPQALVSFDGYMDIVCDCSNLELLKSSPQVCTCDFVKTILTVGCKCGGV